VHQRTALTYSPDLFHGGAEVFDVGQSALCPNLINARIPKGHVRSDIDKDVVREARTGVNATRGTSELLPHHAQANDHPGLILSLPLEADKPGVQLAR
jgi:hypothetical protein